MFVQLMCLSLRSSLGCHEEFRAVAWVAARPWVDPVAGSVSILLN